MDGQARIWVLADDRPGNVAQARGVAEALDRPFCIRDIRYDRFGGLPNLLRGASLLGVAEQSRRALAAPWPHLVIGAGRRTAPIARWLGRRHGARLVQIMDPGWPGRNDFDLIALPSHDRGFAAANVIRTLGTAHRATAGRTALEALHWRERFAHLPRPYIALLVGGPPKSTGFSPAQARLLAAGALALRQRMGGSILATTSRRTGPGGEAALSAALGVAGGGSYFHAWSAGGDNPYMGLLGLADAVVVTGDSMSMCSEACANGGPVFIFAPQGFVGPKYARLHRQLYDAGYARPLGADPSPWRHPPLNAAADIAVAIEDRGLI